MTEHLLRMHKVQGLIHSAKLKEKEKEKEGREGVRDKKRKERRRGGKEGRHKLVRKFLFILEGLK